MARFFHVVESETHERYINVESISGVEVVWSEPGPNVTISTTGGTLLRLTIKEAQGFLDSFKNKGTDHEVK